MAKEKKIKDMEDEDDLDSKIYDESEARMILGI